MPKNTLRHSMGFTLVEVLVSMIILAIGLLGLASLQTISLKNNQDAYLYNQANALAYEMSDRIKANKLGWNPSGTTLAIPTASCDAGCDSAANSCSPNAMAAYDYCYWQTSAAAQLSPDATATITKSNGGSAPCSGNDPALCLTLTWTRINQALNGTTSYQLEVTP